jgi:hypothetical protein
MEVWGFLGGGHMDEPARARIEAAGAARVIADWPHFMRILAA